MNFPEFALYGFQGSYEVGKSSWIDEKFPTLEECYAQDLVNLLWPVATPQKPLPCSAKVLLLHGKLPFYMFYINFT
jgi:hypothetical protein